MWRPVSGVRDPKRMCRVSEEGGGGGAGGEEEADTEGEPGWLPAAFNWKKKDCTFYTL